jgi:hypothetical protein
MAKKMSRSRYVKLFNKVKKINKSVDPLDIAHQIRRFEIELYWKRATYFWAFIIAMGGAYIHLSSRPNPSHDILVLISCLGLLFSIGWYLVGRGSKYWQETWEKHVMWLEDVRTGPLYKTVNGPKSCSFFKLLKGYPYSVSQLNSLLSIFVIIVWVYILIRSLCIAFLQYCEILCVRCFPFNGLVRIVNNGVVYFAEYNCAVLNLAGIILIIMVFFIGLFLLFFSTKSDLDRKEFYHMQDNDDRTP